MEKDLAIKLITLGCLLMVSLLADAIGRRTWLPRVTSLLLFGFVIGHSGLNLIPSFGEKIFHAVADIALVMVGFLLGEKFTFSTLRRYGKMVLCISASEVIATAIVVFIGLFFLGVRIDVALILAGIATALHLLLPLMLFRKVERIIRFLGPCLVLSLLMMPGV